MEVETKDKLGIGMGLVMFILALVYCFADYNTVFDKNDYVGTYKSAVKYAFIFFFDFLGIVFKIMMVLLFIYMFIVVYNIAVVGIFKPLLTENADSNQIISSFSSAREILEEAKKSYMSMIKTVAKTAMKIVFGFIDIPNTILLFFVIIPVYLFFVAFAYYQFILNKKNISKINEQKMLSTNYHYFMILVFTIVISFIIYITLKTLRILSSNTTL
jgi:hypothetical protein